MLCYSGAYVNRVIFTRNNFQLKGTSQLPCLVCSAGSPCWKSLLSFLSVPSTFSTEGQGLGTKYVRGKKKIKKTLNA